MEYRNIFLANPARLSVQREQLVIEQAEKITVPLEDISSVLIESQQVTLSVHAAAAMADHGITVFLCDEKHLPSCQLLPINQFCRQRKLLLSQCEMGKPLQKQLWQQTIKAKIENQASVLSDCSGEVVKCMRIWASDVRSGDPDNLEARAAAYYWKSLFPNIDGFTRDRDGVPPNNLLNYGYSILRAVVARGLVISGLLPTFGIHHHNRYNAYCLADDIMEPYRPYVDELVFRLVESYGSKIELSKEVKARLLTIPTIDVRIGGKRSPLMVAVGQTTASLYRCFTGELRRISYPER